MTRLLAVLVLIGCTEPAIQPPPDHDLRFTRRHAAPEPSACATCHGPDPCARCHRVRAPADHGPAFSAGAHGLRASLAAERCATCHSQPFCGTCHR